MYDKLLHLTTICLDFLPGALVIHLKDVLFQLFVSSIVCMCGGQWTAYRSQQAPHNWAISPTLRGHFKYHLFLSRWSQSSQQYWHRGPHFVHDGAGWTYSSKNIQLKNTERGLQTLTCSIRSTWSLGQQWQTRHQNQPDLTLWRNKSASKALHWCTVCKLLVLTKNSSPPWDKGLQQL